MRVVETRPRPLSTVTSVAWEVVCHQFELPRLDQRARGMALVPVPTDNSFTSDAVLATQLDLVHAAIVSACFHRCSPAA
jgi:hypothetical protein